MAAKTKGRPLPPLLPLEYCSIERAAKMLQVESDDIWHWVEIGALTLSVNTVFDSLFFVVSNETRNELKGLIEANNNGFDYLTLTVNRCTVNIKHSELARTDRYLRAFSCHGIWRLPMAEPFILAKQLGQDNAHPFYVSTGKAEKIYFIGRPFSDELDFKIKLSNLVITADQMQLLHDSITTGKPLANRYNSPIIAAEVIERQRELELTQKQDRLTPGKAKAVTALTELALILAGEDADLMNSPHKLHRRINELMLEHKANKDSGYNLGISDTAYRDLIGAGRSAQKKDSK